MIQLNVQQGTRILELGCGDNPHPQAHVHVDIRQAKGVDFTADFNVMPLPIQDEDFEGIISIFALEHLSWRNVKAFLKDCLRILKTGGNVCFIVPNTEAQLRWIQEHPEGWDGKDFYESASCKLFGDNDYAENTHRCFFSPTVILSLFQEAGFSDIVVRPFGERATDLVITGIKQQTTQSVAQKTGHEEFVTGDRTVLAESGSIIATSSHALSSVPRTEIFNRQYFDGGHPQFGGYQSYADYPKNHVVARNILMRRPASVLELGCARGYVLKRLQDYGIAAEGLEISKHAYLTRVCDSITTHDLCKTPWMGVAGSIQAYDLCFSNAVLECIPEKHLPDVISEMVRTCKRGLHAIRFEEDEKDNTLTTIKSRDWWKALFHKHAPDWPVEILSQEEMERGEIPPDILAGDGKVKLHLGSFVTMFHHGWTNIDIHDLGGFAQANGYNYLRHDLKKGIPANTGSVDLLFSHHVLEHFTYREAEALLKDCRRVLKPTGAMRIVVPDLTSIMTMYSDGVLSELDEMNGGVAESPTDAGKLWALLCSAHQSSFDFNTMLKMLTDAGFSASRAEFRKSDYIPGIHVSPKRFDLILKTAMEMDYGGTSLFVNCVPRIE